MTIRTELETLQAQSADIGILQPRIIVDWARDNPASALHGQFEWDDSKAGEQYRINQARSLITVHLIYADRTPRVVSLSVDRPAGGGYRPMETVLTTPTLHADLLDKAVAHLERTVVLYGQLHELDDVWKAIDKTVRRHQKSSAKQPLPTGKAEQPAAG